MSEAERRCRACGKPICDYIAALRREATADKDTEIERLQRQIGTVISIVNSYHDGDQAQDAIKRALSEGAP